MLVLAILAVIVSLGTVFLIYFFINICRDPRKGHAIVFVEVLTGPAKARVSLSRALINPNYDLIDRDRREVGQGGSRARLA
jgi:hypothetical protein